MLATSWPSREPRLVQTIRSSGQAWCTMLHTKTSGRDIPCEVAIRFFRLPLQQ
jgi:hypothetical protein